MTADSIAVVVVTHDSASYVGDTLAALRGQLREGDELIVVDNGSGDATPAAVRAAAPGAGWASGLRNSSRAPLASCAPRVAPPAKPRLSCSTSRASGAAARTAVAVASPEPLSTTISSSPSRSCARTAASVSAT